MKQATMVEIEGERLSLLPSSANTSWKIQGKDLVITINEDGDIAVNHGRNLFIESHSVTSTLTTTPSFGRQRKLNLDTLWPRVSEQLEASYQEKEEEYKRMEKELMERRAKDDDVEAMRAEIADKLAEMETDCKERKAQTEAWDKNDRSGSITMVTQ